VSLDPRAVRPADPPPCVLIVDDDKRVIELLEIAFAAHGYRVVSACDGDEALKRIASDHPDVVVLDVRLPKRNGLEVCEMLRRDPHESSIPVIVVSATVETETRLQAFRRGADDYLTKPFSPKELVARVRRLLTRSSEMSESRRRQRELERDLGRARDELGRAHVESRRERRLREMAFGLGHDLHRTLDPGLLASRLLDAVRAHLGVEFAGLLAAGTEGGPLLPAAVRGDSLERLAGLEITIGSEFARLASGLGRPVRRHEIESLPELEPELPAFVSAGVALAIPLRGPAGLEGLIVTDERADGRGFPPADLEIVAGLSELAAVALRNSRIAREQTDAMLGLIAEFAGPEGRAHREEAGALAGRAARGLRMAPRLRALLGHAMRLGTWGAGPDGEAAIARLESTGLPGYVAELRWLLRRAHGLELADAECPEREDAAALLAVALLYAGNRAEGACAEDALATALRGADPAPDRAIRQALEAATREQALLEA